MRKLTSLLMLLCVFVGTAWGQGTEDYTLIRVSHEGWKVTAQNQCPSVSGNEGGLAFIEDENQATFYHSDWYGNKDGKNGKQGFLVEMKEEVSNIARITYAGRSDNNASGWASKVRIYVYTTLPEGFPSDLSTLSVAEKNTLFDNTELLGTPAYDNSETPWIKDDKQMKTADFAEVSGKYILFIQDEGQDSWLTCSDFQVYKKVATSSTCTVKYEFYYNNVKKDAYTQEFAALVGEAYPDFVLPDFVEASKPSGIIEASVVVDRTVVVRIDFTVNLPFKESDSYENAIWQVIDMHSNENNYTWKFVAADEPVETPVVAKSLNEMLGDEYYWAFVGNFFDGFKIYNKKAGGDLTLRKAETGNTISVMSSTDDKNQFKVYSSTAIDGAFCFKLDGDDYYLNKQAEGDKKILKGWNQTDNGSSCRSFSPASFLISTAESYSTIPAGAVGSPKDESLVEGVVSVLPAVKEDEYNISKTAELSALLVQLEASEKYSLETGKPYRLQNLFRESMVAFDGTNRVKSPIGKTDVSNIWLFENAATDGKFYIKNLSANAYMKAADGGNDLVATDGAEYTVAPLGCAQYNLQSGGNLVIYGGGSLGSWSPNPLGSDGAWYIIPATDIEVVVDEAGYATTYLPFAVTLPEGVKAYAVDAVDGDVAKLVEKADIPANTGAIIAGEGTHTLDIVATATADWTGNLLKGSNVPANIAEKAYVLAMPEGETVGFYAAKFNVSTDATNDGEEGAEDDTFEAFVNNANKAYLPASAVASGARFLSFDFGTETAIESIEGTETENTVVYDLAGRRVQKAQKGLYIVNGKKVIK